MKFASITQIERAGVELDDVLATDLPMATIVKQWGVAAEEIIRDGLGSFDFIFVYTDNIGYWGFSGSRLRPEFNAVVWAQLGISESALITTVKRALEPTTCRIMRSSTGEIVA